MTEMKTLAAFIIATIFMQELFAATDITVAAYNFPPYYERRGDAHFGLTASVVTLLNKMQSEYKFSIYTIPPKRRYEILESKQADLLFFEDQVWGWKGLKIDFLQLPISDGESFFATKNRTQSYFNSLTGKTVVGIFGYHYACTNFSENPTKDSKDFHFMAVDDRSILINMITEQRADIGILGTSYLSKTFSENPVLADKILVSDKLDQIYNLGVISSKTSPLRDKKLKKLIQRLLKNEQFIQEANTLGLLKKK